MNVIDKLQVVTFLGGRWNDGLFGIVGGHIAFGL